MTKPYHWRNSITEERAGSAIESVVDQGGVARLTFVSGTFLDEIFCIMNLLNQEGMHITQRRMINRGFSPKCVLDIEKTEGVTIERLQSLLGNKSLELSNQRMGR